MIQRVKALSFPKTEYWVVAGGAMVLHGFRPLTHDVDLGCTTLLADQLEGQGYPVSRRDDRTRKIVYSEDVEIFENWLEGTVETVSGIPVVGVEGLVRMKRKLGREKDLADIALIEKRKNLSEMTLEELWALFPIFLTAHKDCWAENYREMEAYLRAGLHGIPIVRISHIGSTAIRNIWAKDIVDILLEVAPGENLAAIAKAIEKIGFTKMSAAENRYSFNWGYTEEGFGEKVYHLHLRYAGDHDELYFRDYMNDHPKDAKAYETLKLELWKKYEHDRDGYTDAKTAFVEKYTEAGKKIYPNRYKEEECK